MTVWKPEYCSEYCSEYPAYGREIRVRTVLCLVCCSELSDKKFKSINMEGNPIQDPKVKRILLKECK